MTTQRRVTGVWIVGLALALVVLLGAPGVGQNAWAADAHHILMEAPITVTQNQKIELMAMVRDSKGQPVAGVPVEFRVESGWEKNITLSSQRPMTDKNGEVRTTFASNMTGVVHLTAQTGDAATMAHIAVSASGSRR